MLTLNDASLSSSPLLSTGSASRKISPISAVADVPACCTAVPYTCVRSKRERYSSKMTAMVLALSAHVVRDRPLKWWLLVLLFREGSVPVQYWT